MTTFFNSISFISQSTVSIPSNSYATVFASGSELFFSREMELPNNIDRLS